MDQKPMERIQTTHKKYAFMSEVAWSPSSLSGRQDFLIRFHEHHKWIAKVSVPPPGLCKCCPGESSIWASSEKALCEDLKGAQLLQVTSHLSCAQKAICIPSCSSTFKVASFYSKQEGSDSSLSRFWHSRPLIWNNRKGPEAPQMDKMVLRVARWGNLLLPCTIPWRSKEHSSQAEVFKLDVNQRNTGKKRKRNKQHR